MGMVHRDIKPHNVFLSATPPVVAKLGDFGLASSVTDHNAAFTPRFAAPEVLLGGSCDHAGDVYSLGLVIYETVSLVRGRRANDRMAAPSAIPVDDLSAAAAAAHDPLLQVRARARVRACEHLFL